MQQSLAMDLDRNLIAVVHIVTIATVMAIPNRSVFCWWVFLMDIDCTNEMEHLAPPSVNLTGNSCFSSTHSGTLWIVDSGATHHIVSDLNLLLNAIETNSFPLVKLPNGSMPNSLEATVSPSSSDNTESPTNYSLLPDSHMMSSAPNIPL
ncbi:hypothetical protein QYF36_024475 [Acer negundo]|nr:hypothetical protein QYF36_024475 [Acer negundo]